MSLLGERLVIFYNVWKYFLKFELKIVVIKENYDITLKIKL